MLCAFIKKSASVLLFLMVLSFMQNLWAETEASLSGPYPPDITNIKKRGVLNIAIYSGAEPPFLMQDTAGHPTGIEIDLGRMIASELGVKANFKPVDTFDGVINMVANKQADIGMGLLNISPERALMVHFSIPYYTYHPYLVINCIQLANYGWPLWDAIKNLQKTNAPIKIGAINTTANIDLIKAALPHAKIVGFDTPAALMEAAASGNIFAALANTPEQIDDWFAQNPKAVLATAHIVIPDRSVLFGIAVQWQEENLLQWLNVYIDYLQRNHIITQLFQKYGAEETNS